MVLPSLFMVITIQIVGFTIQILGPWANLTGSLMPFIRLIWLHTPELWAHSHTSVIHSKLLCFQAISSIVTAIMVFMVLCPFLVSTIHMQFYNWTRLQCSSIQVLKFLQSSWSWYTSVLSWLSQNGRLLSLFKSQLKTSNKIVVFTCTSVLDS